VTIGRPGVDIAAQPVRRGRMTPPLPGTSAKTFAIDDPNKKSTPTPNATPKKEGLKTPKTPNSAKEPEKLQSLPKPKKSNLKKTPTPQQTPKEAEEEKTPAP